MVARDQTVQDLRRNGDFLLSILAEAGADIKNPKSISCPFHDDHKPSADIWIDTDGVQRFKCHACEVGGDVFDLIAKLSGKPIEEVLKEHSNRNGDSRLHPNDNGQSKTFVIAYDYRDESGNLLSQVHRYRLPDGTKTFRQRQPDGNGGWLWNIRGVRRVPYRLQEAIEAKANDDIILIVEGERDVHSAEDLGFAATCNAGGAGKWTDKDSEPFQGAKFVVIIPDNDARGRNHAHDVARSLYGKVETIKTLKPFGTREGYDLSDWIEDGGDREKLIELIDATPASDVTTDSEIEGPSPTEKEYPSKPIGGGELMAMEYDPVLWVVERILPEGLTLLGGKPKVGKSWLVLCLAVAVAKGIEALGRFKTIKGDVLYLAQEDTLKRMQDRLRKVLRGEPVPSNLSMVTGWPQLHQGTLAGWELFVEEHPNVRMIIVDTLQTIRNSSKSGNRSLYADDVEALRPLREFAGKHGIALIVVHHLRKMEAEDPFDLVSGSLGLTGTADTIWILKRSRSGGATGELFIRGREAEDQEYAVDLKNCQWMIQGNLDEFKYGDLRREIVSILKDAGKALTKTEIQDDLPTVAPNYFSNLLCRMKKDGQIKSPARGEYEYVDPVAAWQE